MHCHYGKWFRGCPLLGGEKCTVTMGSGSEVVLFLEVTNALWEVECNLFRGCPLFGAS